MNITSASSRRTRRAFTVLELLVSMTVLALLLVLVARITGDVQRAWQQSSAKVYQFREARRAFDLMKTNVSQATLNTYTRYYYNNPTNPFLPYNITATNQLATNSSAQQEYLPLGFTLFSELQFLAVPCSFMFPSVTGNGQIAAVGHALFFQAPLGQTLPSSSLVTNIYGNNAGQAAASGNGSSTPSLPSAMNARGYFVLFGSDSPWRPSMITPDRIPYKYRYRLMEFSPTSEYNLIYGDNITNPATNPYAYDPSQCTQSATPVPGSVTNMNTSQWILAASNGTLPNYLQWARPVADNVIALIVSPQSPVAKGATGLPTDIAPQYYYNSSAYQISSAAGGNQALPAWAFQLPPEVQLTMIVIDELSAETLANASPTGSSPTPPLGFLSGNTLFSTASSYSADIANIQQQLSQYVPKLNWRIFTANVVLRNARWNGTPSS